MRVVLEVKEGPDAGRRVVLRARQSLNVGRTERSDFVLSGDDLLSSRHFSVECDDSACQLRDLESTNGTLVNGQPVGQTRLRNGDEIQAGQTLLRVSIEGLPADGPWLDAPIAAPAITASALRMPILCRQRACGSGLMLIESQQPEPTPAVVAHRWGGVAAAYVLFDPRKIALHEGQPAPGEPLLAELPPEIAPRLLPLAEAMSLVETNWGRDALAVLLSKADPAALADHLRSAFWFDPATRTAKPGGGLLAFHWPSVGRVFLEHCPEATLAGILGDSVEGVMYEGLAPLVWHCFARPALAGSAKAAGFEIEATP